VLGAVVGRAYGGALLEHGDRVLHRDEAGDIGFAQVERLRHRVSILVRLTAPA
jgi:hypothetical protein